MLGAAGGAGLKFAADSYAAGAVSGFKVKTASINLELSKIIKKIYFKI
jgi:hypothetical protein